MTLVCKICKHESRPLFIQKVLRKYDVAYYQCTACEFIQTEDPYWLDEAYENIITQLDIGLIARNLHIGPVMKSLIYRCFNTDRKFLDYGGGYGLLVRMMRDQGLDFYRQDKYCENIFSKNFDITDLGGHEEFEMLSAFELFEHLVDPVKEVIEMQKLSKSILFSTTLIPSPEAISSWEYLALETGQHIALYSHKSLQALAKNFDVNLYSNHKNLHLLTPKKMNQQWFKLQSNSGVSKIYNFVIAPRRSFLEKDYQSTKKRLNADMNNVN